MHFLADVRVLSRQETKSPEESVISVSVADRAS